ACISASAASAASAYSKRAFHASCGLLVVHRANHYSILGVPTSATPGEIKTAFYKCSMKWHPDKNQGSDEAHRQFLKINEAYSVLGNEQSRSAYDRKMQIRSSGYTSARGTSAPHRYHNSAFSSSGEYSSAKRSEPHSSTYRRPAGTYTSYTRNGQRVKSNFEEWERQHYETIKEKSESIRRHAHEEAERSKYSPTQVTFYQFYELCFVFAVVYGIAWAGSYVIRASEDQRGSSSSSAAKSPTRQ
ncbi:hypothetical protein GGI12_005284, partial [Dipsacomyces acuminosporus]